MIRNLSHYLSLRKKTILFLIAFFFIITTKQAFAAVDTFDIDTTNLQGYLDKQTAITKGNNQESWINESLISNVVSINQAIGGSVSQTSLKSAWVPGGMIGFTNNAIASLYQPPASGIQYIAQSVNSFLGKPTYAATTGFGFDKLNGIVGMWKVTRNAVYTLISLFFIIVGIMIMLRVKINPQTTVTVQSAIPKIISTLILVTFSYAIAGLIIDFLNLFQGIILSLINQGVNGTTTSIVKKTVSELMQLNFREAFNLSFSLGWNNVTQIVSVIAGLIGGAVGGYMVAATLGTGIVGGLIAGVLTFGLILAAILIFTLIQVFKLFLGLAKCYVVAIIHIIIGPIEIGMGAIPGSKVNFSTWLVNVLANLSVFPATIIFLVFANFLTQSLNRTDTFLWSSTILGSGSIVSSIVGLACLAMLSKVPQLVPEMLFKIKPSPIGKAISEGASNNIFARGLNTIKQGVQKQQAENIGGLYNDNISKPIKNQFRNFSKTHSIPLNEQTWSQSRATVKERRKNKKITNENENGGGI